MWFVFLIAYAEAHRLLRNHGRTASTAIQDIWRGPMTIDTDGEYAIDTARSVKLLQKSHVSFEELPERQSFAFFAKVIFALSPVVN